MTTIPTREDSVIKTIQSIQSGTVKPDTIQVNLPEWYPRFKKGPDPNLETKLKVPWSAAMKRSGKDVDPY